MQEIQERPQAGDEGNEGVWGGAPPRTPISQSARRSMERQGDTGAPASGRRTNHITGEWETPFDGACLRAADAALHNGFNGRPGGALCSRGRFAASPLHALFSVHCSLGVREHPRRA